jgi:tRNA pseudouridine55 synthase
MGKGTSRGGVLVVDKPSGPTSHDVVARARRALGERRIGHAGTLDPMASGVLVVLVGEATKLAPYVTANDKRYTARVALGVGTDTLDAEGAVVARVGVPEELLLELTALATPNSPGLIAGNSPGLMISEAIRGETARRAQVPPAYSAVKVDGVRSYTRARAGAEVELAPRPVEVRHLRVTAAGLEPTPWIDIELEVTKGYYVRSLGRDLGERLGVPAHLVALRRTSSGPFDLAQARPLDDLIGAELEPTASAAARALGAAHLTEAGAARVRLGQRPATHEFVSDPASEQALPTGGPRAWLDPSGALVAIGEQEGDRYAILRGFVA